MIASLAFTTDRIITAVLEYSEKNETAIREACSAILMRLLARSLVVTTDVLVATTMQEIQRAMRDFDEHLDPVIDKLDNAYKTDHVADVLHETIAISAEVFDASGATYQRARPEIRELLYKLIDGHMQLPAPDEIPHKEALVKLATHIVTLLEQNLVGFAEALLRLLEERLYDKFQDIVNEVNQQVDEWKQEITAVHAKIHDQVIWIEKQLGEFETKIEKSVNLQVQQTNNMIDDVSAHPEQIRAQLRKALHNEAMKSAPKEAHLKQVYTQAVDGAIGTVGEKAIASMVVASCKSFKQDRELINAFLRDARQSSHSKSIAKCFGGHQGKIVARQLQMTIPFPKLVPLNPLTVKVPEKAVRAAFGTGAGLSANLVTMADALMALFSEQTKSESSRKETTDESAKVKQKEATTQRLIEARAADDAKVEIVYPPANAFIPAGVDAAIKIRLENVPVEYLARQSLEQPRLLIWVNQVLVDLQSIEPDLQANAFTLTFSPDSLRYGPNRVTVMLADCNLPQESVGFFREVPKTENNKGLGISDNDIMDGIHQAQEYLRAKTKKAITEASDLVK